MWSCEDKLKGKTAHFQLLCTSQKRTCLSSLIRSRTHFEEEAEVAFKPYMQPHFQGLFVDDNGDPGNEVAVRSCRACTYGKRASNTLCPVNRG